MRSQTLALILLVISLRQFYGFHKSGTKISQKRLNSLVSQRISSINQIPCPSYLLDTQKSVIYSNFNQFPEYEKPLNGFHRIYRSKDRFTRNLLGKIQSTTSSWVESMKPTKKSNEMWNIPNILSLFRIAIIPVFLGSFIFEQRNLGIFLFILASLTDLVDGYLARKWNQTSEFGAFLDPVADKLMVASALSLLVCNLPVWWFAIPVALVLCREIGVSALREWMSSKGLRDVVQVGKLGKWKTALQMISISLLLFSSNPIVERKGGSASIDEIGLMQSMLLSIGLLGFYGSTILTIISGYQYFKAAWPRLSASNDLTEVPTN